MGHRFKTCAMFALMLAAGTALAQNASPAALLLEANERMLASFQAMPEVRLKTLVLRCAQESSERVLSAAEALPCSIAWDTLLQREFDGDLDSLLAWWRAHRDQVSAR